VAILAPRPDGDTLKTMVGSLSGALAGVSNPLPRLGRCAPTHTNAVFSPVVCEPGSTQWVWLGEHRKPAGAYPGKAKAQKEANDGCRPLAGALGGGGAFVYYPTNPASWAKARADWSCWMPLAKVKGK